MNPNPSPSRSMRDRHDRYVKRAQLRISPGAPRHRLAFAIQEALRLLSLPGEDQGRTYYFRRLRVTGLPPDGDRGAWLSRFQKVIEQQAKQAVHGADPRAGLAEVVFFRSQPEALELLLHRRLARRQAQEWFWPMVSGERSAAPPSLPDLIERLRAQPASWVAVAASLFAQPGFDAVGLLHAIPPAVLSAWLHDIDPTSNLQAIYDRNAAPNPRPAPSPRLAPSAPPPVYDTPWLQQPAVQRALQTFGPAHPGVLWLSALALLLDSPSALAAGVALQQAHIALRQLAIMLEMRPDGSPHPKSPAATQPTHSTSTPAPGSHEHEAGQPAPSPSIVSTPLPTRTDRQAAATTPNKPEQPAIKPSNPPPAPETSAAPTPPSTQLPPRQLATVLPAPEQSSQLDPQQLATPLPWLVSATPTHAAGLFFLLNAMQRIGAPEALSLTLAVPHFVPRVLLHLSQQANQAQDDPIVTWLQTLIPALPQPDPPQPFDPSWWPRNLRLAMPLATRETLIRLWSLAVRRWCWRQARVSARQIIQRNGLFYVNRIDLDVSLPIEAADLRIRRAGLDLDLGWLPWFGRVVRFHYVFPGDLHG